MFPPSSHCVTCGMEWHSHSCIWPFLPASLVPPFQPRAPGTIWASLIPHGCVQPPGPPAQPHSHSAASLAFSRLWASLLLPAVGHTHTHSIPHLSGSNWMQEPLLSTAHQPGTFPTQLCLHLDSICWHTHCQGLLRDCMLLQCCPQA